MKQKQRITFLALASFFLILLIYGLLSGDLDLTRIEGGAL